MTEINPNTHEPTSVKIGKLYPQYMEMIRAFISEGVIEVEEPTEKQKQWAHMVSRGENDLERAIALLARITEHAYKQRYLEGMPMLNDFDSPSGGPHNGFESIERFHFLRNFIREYRQLEGTEPLDQLPGVPIVLYENPAQI